MMSIPNRYAPHRENPIGRFTCFVGMGLLAICALHCSKPVVAPETKVVLGRDWHQKDRVSLNEVRHDLWTSLLKRYVDKNGSVDYANWKQSSADLRSLDEYLDLLSRASPDLPGTREARLAFWINAYNAVTIKGILREFPTQSIQDLASESGGYNIWRDLLLKVGGNSYSLGQIEHEILRKMDEPRIHFAIVCASKGCPQLGNEAYTSDNIEAQLKSNSQALFADSSKCYYDASKNQLYLSPILQWYADDFGANQGEQLKTIAPYLPAPVREELKKAGKADVSFLEYDWTLNGQATVPQVNDGNKGSQD